MATYAPSPILTDGQNDWSGGVNSLAVTTMKGVNSPFPNGLEVNQLAWLVNGKVRDGGISPRTGWQLLGNIHDASGLYQGGFMYEPNDADPYLVISISGHIYRVPVDAPSSLVDLSSSPGLVNPVLAPQAYFCQAEQFLVIQAGDMTTLPLFWDGTTLRRSKGITNTSVGPGTPGVNEIPAATAMDYYMGRLWYAQSRNYSAGDIVGGSSGTVGYKFRDAVLNVTENPMVLGGDGFTVPTNAGTIRALKHSSVLDATLGEGRLYIFTRRAIYSLQVPVTRTDWINADSKNQPLQTVVQLTNGAVNDRSIVAVNGDLFFQSLEPSIRSLIAALRYFSQWGNISISKNEQRLIGANNRTLLHMASGITFDNRLLQTAMPLQKSQGVTHQALIPLDFLPLSGFGTNPSPIWEGAYEGLQILQMFTGDYGGRQRAFALTVSQLDASIQLWELTDYLRGDINTSGESRTSWQIETPAYTFGDIKKLKKLVGGEVWIDQLFGEAVFTLEYRPDGESCWSMWHQWKVCTARNTAEDALEPQTYPVQPLYDSYRQTITLPKPQDVCTQVRTRPMSIGYQFQCRITVKGNARIRGFYVHAEPVERNLYADLQCPN